MLAPARARSDARADVTDVAIDSPVLPLAPEEFFECLAHNSRVWLGASPLLNTDDALIHQHSPSVKCCTACCVGLSDQMGSGWIGNHIGNDHGGSQRRVVNVQTGIDVREQPYGSGVHDD